MTAVVKTDTEVQFIIYGTKLMKVIKSWGTAMSDVDDDVATPSDIDESAIVLDYDLY